MKTLILGLLVFGFTCVGHAMPTGILKGTISTGENIVMPPISKECRAMMGKWVESCVGSTGYVWADEDIVIDSSSCNPGKNREVYDIVDRDGKLLGRTTLITGWTPSKKGNVVRYRIIGHYVPAANNATKEKKWTGYGSLALINGRLTRGIVMDVEVDGKTTQRANICNAVK